MSATHACLSTTLAALAAVFIGDMAKAAQPDSAQASLLAAEDRMFQAEIHADRAAIASAFADDGTFTHANGMVQSKSMYIDAIVDGHLAFHSILPDHRVAWVSGPLGVTHANMQLVVGQMHLGGSYTAVYRLHAGQWQLVDWQSSAAVGGQHPPQ